jgi:hypothetical protein
MHNTNSGEGERRDGVNVHPPSVVVLTSPSRPAVRKVYDAKN